MQGFTWTLALAASVAVAMRPATWVQPPAVVGPEVVTFTSAGLTLHGQMWKPAGAGPFPAVLYNHGSERTVKAPPNLGPVFARHGYLFFLPHRRGQGLSAHQGSYISTLLASEGKTRGAEARSRLLVTLHETDQLSDQLAALAWLKARPDVDVSRLGIAGCSFGGIQTVLSAERALGIKAAIDFAGAAQSWDRSPDLRARMAAAVRNAKVPIYFMQAENDYNLAPSRTLAAEMQRAGKPHQMKIFPAFGTTNADGHGGFCYSGSEVWGDEVFAFLDEYLGR